MNIDFILIARKIILLGEGRLIFAKFAQTTAIYYKNSFIDIAIMNWEIRFVMRCIRGETKSFNELHFGNSHVRRYVSFHRDNENV